MVTALSSLEVDCLACRCWRKVTTTAIRTPATCFAPRAPTSPTLCAPAATSCFTLQSADPGPVLEVGTCSVAWHKCCRLMSVQLRFTTSLCTAGLRHDGRDRAIHSQVSCRLASFLCSRTPKCPLASSAVDERRTASPIKMHGPTPSTLLQCRGLIQATLHLVNREYAALADDFITLGLLPPGSDRAAIVPALTGVFQVCGSIFDAKGQGSVVRVFVAARVDC